MRAHAIVALTLALALVSLRAAPVRAQGTTGSLAGIVAERVAEGESRRASIALTRLEPEPNLSFAATTDRVGRYHLDSLPPGRYLLQLGSPLLDSLELALAPRPLEIVAGRTTHADLTLPSGRALRDAVCPGLPMGADLAAIAGRAIDADTEQPIPGAEVVVSWTQVEVDTKTLEPSRQERTAAVKSGARGEYRLCGVPSGAWLSLQLQHLGRAGAIVRVSVSDDEGAAARDLSISAREAPTMAVLDSMDRLAATVGVDSTTGELLLTGTASISGVVRGAGGLPLSGAQVHVRDARGMATTGENGAFALDRLPAGTQTLVVRRLGYALAELTVELREGRKIERDVQLERAVSLDSMRVTALGSRYRDFDFARGANVLGRFLTRDQIERRSVEETGDLLLRLGGFDVVGKGSLARVYTKGSAFAKKDPRDDKACSEVNVVIDGVQDMGINSVTPSRIVGLEAYTGPTTFSSKYRSSCGLIVIWTTAWGRDDAKRARPASKQS